MAERVKLHLEAVARSDSGSNLKFFHRSLFTMAFDNAAAEFEKIDNQIWPF